jgi:23S rRNA pseudouridine2605 synthase
MNNSPHIIRLNKFLSLAGITSRRNADELISNGKIIVNKNRVTELGTKINPGIDKVFYNGKQVVILDKPVYIVLNKPKDCITTLDDERSRTTIMDYVKTNQRVFPVGRLDRNTTGVLLLTNDGELANALMHPKHEIKKTYHVEIDKPLSVEHEKELKRGVKLEDGMTSKSEVFILPKGKRKVIGISIHEGKNRQVRRMFESFGYEIEKLERVAYDYITCEGLKRGEWRYLTEKEIATLKSSLANM